QSPLSARIGLGMILINVAAAVLVPFVAPYTETEVVGDVWLPSSKEHLLG
ncbi:MAG: ABC transporter permease, partial [Deltaproteobacteria bacterium]|nr:ABC transporter permease [Deltaproteobacteria bacterium]